MVHDGSSGKVQNKRVGLVSFLLTAFLSIVYLGIVTAILLFEPFVKIDTLEIMKQSGIYLGPLQGLVTATLWIFFDKKEQA